MYQFAGGYYSFDGNNKPECHYYIADYQGPRSNKGGLIILREKTNIYVRGNRMVVNAHTNAVEQTTHYYPYGGIIGNLSSNQEAQKYKYSNKELDRTYGLDLYDFHARLFNPALPVFDRPDPLAEDFTWLTPYNYCAGDPVNLVDKDGQCPAWAVSVPLCAVGGALIGAGVAAWTSGGDFRQVVAGAAGGFVSGAIAGTGVGLLSEIGATGVAGVVAEIGINAGTGAISSAAGNATEQLVSTGEVDTEEVGASMFAGCLTGAISGVASKCLKPVTDKIASQAGAKVEIKVKDQLTQLKKNGVKTGSNNRQNLTKDGITNKAKASGRKEEATVKTEISSLGTLDPMIQTINYEIKKDEKQ